MLGRRLLNKHGLKLGETLRHDGIKQIIAFGLSAVFKRGLTIGGVGSWSNIR